MAKAIEPNRRNYSINFASKWIQTISVNEVVSRFLRSCVVYSVWNWMKTRGYCTAKFITQNTEYLQWKSMVFYEIHRRIDFIWRFVHFSSGKCRDFGIFSRNYSLWFGLTLCMPLGVSKKWPNCSWIFQHDDSPAPPLSCPMPVRTTYRFQHFIQRPMLLNSELCWYCGQSCLNMSRTIPLCRFNNMGHLA